MTGSKLLLLVSLFTLYNSGYAQKGNITSQKSKVATTPTKIILIDTAFATMGVKFGFPKNYKAFVPGSNPNYMELWSADSSISITIQSSSSDRYATVIAKWPAENQKAMPDNWYRNIGKTASKHYSHTKPVFISQYIYPYNFGGAELILIELKTYVANKGLAEFEAIKASVQRRAVPLIEQPVVPGEFTMGIPAYMIRDLDNGTLSTFRGANSAISFHKSSLSKSSMYQSHVSIHKEQQLGYGFKVWGMIAGETAEGNGFYGYCGEGTDLSGKPQVMGYVFFKKPGTIGEERCWYVQYRLIGGNSISIDTDMKEFLKTLKSL
ncbi:MAG: hypothetical protein ABIP79_15880 [Chitinophagaceae bacterium]